MTGSCGWGLLPVRLLDRRRAREVVHQLLFERRVFCASRRVHGLRDGHRARHPCRIQRRSPAFVGAPFSPRPPPVLASISSPATPLDSMPLFTLCTLYEDRSATAPAPRLPGRFETPLRKLVLSPQLSHPNTTPDFSFSWCAQKVMCCLGDALQVSRKEADARGESRGSKQEPRCAPQTATPI